MRSHRKPSLVVIPDPDAPFCRYNTRRSLGTLPAIPRIDLRSPGEKQKPAGDFNFLPRIGISILQEAQLSQFHRYRLNNGYQSTKTSLTCRQHTLILESNPENRRESSFATTIIIGQKLHTLQNALPLSTINPKEPARYKQTPTSRSTAFSLASSQTSFEKTSPPHNLRNVAASFTTDWHHSHSCVSEDFNPIQETQRCNTTRRTA